MKKKAKKGIVAAIVTLVDADKMSAKGRKDIAAWLRRTAADLVKLGDQYSGRFKATYWVEK